MPRSEGIETQINISVTTVDNGPERMPRSEGIETSTRPVTIIPGGIPGTNAPIRGD